MYEICTCIRFFADQYEDLLQLDMLGWDHMTLFHVIHWTLSPNYTTGKKED